MDPPIDVRWAEYNQTQVFEVIFSKCGSLHEAFKEGDAPRQVLLLPSLQVRGKDAVQPGRCELK